MPQTLRALVAIIALAAAGAVVVVAWKLTAWLVGEWAGYAVLASVVFACWYFGDRPGIVRRRRLASGQCERCGYDLRGNETCVCPECGTAFEVRARAKVE